MPYLIRQQLFGNVAEVLLDSPLAIGSTFASFEQECYIKEEMDLMNLNNIQITEKYISNMPLNILNKAMIYYRLMKKP